MATAFRTTTPPPSTSLHTPQTPRFGFDDSYEPYSPRKSSRVSAQRARAARTPPPQSSKSSKKTVNTSPPSSPPTASKKRTPKTSPMMSGRRVSGALSADSAASAAAALGLPTPEPQRKLDQKPAATGIRNHSLLPTPNKTPKKRPSESAPGITAIARNLFPIRPETVEEVMPSPKKGRKRYKGFTIDSFEAEEESSPVQIYTDSHDRVPEVDMSADNPFYGPSGVVPEPTKRASKRRKINVPGEGERSAEEVEQREDGLVYVFRGKKVFRKFTDEEGSQREDSVEDEELAQTVLPNLRRPLTRSSIKPRLLFPTAEQTKAKEKRSQTTEDEEEAITDIEEAHAPMDVDDHVSTPKPPKFAPATPPTTARATRSKKVDMDTSLLSDDEATVPSPTHIDSGAGARLSPFDNWPRTKRQGSGNSASKKREGTSINRASKKIRG